MTKSYHSYHVSSRIHVQCSDCGTGWMKSKYTLKGWQGRCRSCAQKVETNKPERKASLSENARQQVILQGGVPNARHLTSERVRGTNNVNWKHSRRGAETPNWKGGITPKTKAIRDSKKYREWRTAIFIRDDYTCQICGLRGVCLHVDHYPVPFSQLFAQLCAVLGPGRADEFAPLWDARNGRTLCAPCHRAHGWRFTSKRMAQI